ncbi:hypothetical protein QZM89_06395 [Burkholderia gladioli]|uniref:hypothetical protein n=1 Tax=Burkholderia gladioli TaxID=28095 RepID=UPI00264E8F85|nr:hypothetical protein [Burkholderia gladioli]MDN7494807.1 hypothetical protein [Burkholderia gladioli]
MATLIHPVPPEHLQEIGDMTVSFALLEGTLQSLAGFLMSWNNVRDREQVRVENMVLASLPFKGLRALISALSKERFGDNSPQDTEISGLLKWAQEIEERRNTITHSQWGTGNTNTSITRFKNAVREKTGHKFSVEYIELEDLKKIPIEIRALAAAVMDADFRFQDAAGKIPTISATPRET